ncbi:DUF2946 domain-containing protein [Sphaerotilus microaerophilus]|uniref:DUF2946 domain-containing protein n=1 Tax=Sphaerotilus microaerophilus TaxID=2914710 RepID=A0ABM7YPE9_9BURK|nr:DUF2946 domain-containing protein [Sphaerotilus sp. FB-5]BDI06363.1 hypothetical protein CATMQ487_33330 [Sphaerotilus sp. FB-5]
MQVRHGSVPGLTGLSSQALHCGGTPDLTLTVVHLLRRYRLPHWIALLAMWFAAFAPTVSHALARAEAIEWVDICSAVAPSASVDHGAAAGDAEPADWLGELRACGYCVPAFGAAPLPSSPGAAGMAVVEHRSPPPPASADACLAQVAWALLPSRAPPAPG